MIAFPESFPALFSDSDIPADAVITDEAADALAAILWAVAENELAAEALAAADREGRAQ